MSSGKHTSQSNYLFEKSLKKQNADWGLRDVDLVTSEANKNGFMRAETIQMPANNSSIILFKT